MEQNFEKVKSKIKKLLALSKSPNPHEAAAALEMAQKLMAEYKLERDEFSGLDIGEEETKTVRRENAPLYESLLALRIAEAFGCIHFYYQGKHCRWIFAGLKHRAQIAAFIGQVLFRKVRAARAEYLKTLSRVRSRGRKTARADDYCFSWAVAVTEKLTAFAGSSPEEKKEITRHVAKNHPDLQNFKPITRRGSEQDRLKGFADGKTVELRHGVGMASGAVPLLSGGKT